MDYDALKLHLAVLYVVVFRIGLFLERGVEISEVFVIADDAETVARKYGVVG